jgi:hypothetical protein
VDAAPELETRFNLRRRSTISGALAALLAGAVAIFAGLLVPGAGSLSGIFLVAGLAIGAGAVATLFTTTRFVLGPVVVDREGVRLGAALVPRSAIRSAYFAPAAGRLRSCVRLVGEGDGTLAQIEVASQREADELLDALALGPTQRAARFRAFAPRGSPSWNAGMVFLAAGLVTMALSFPLHTPWLIGLSLAIFVVGSAVFLPYTLHVGADGLWIATRVRPRFVPWSAVIAIEPYDRGVVVRGHGEVVTLQMTTASTLANEHDLVAREALLARATEALAAYRRGDVPDVAARVARLGRPHREWMRALFDREGDFRAAPLLDDQLWTVVESPMADVTARAGAAVVLARSAGDAERSRLRIVAEACTAPGLRVVLDKASSGASDAEVEEALAAMEDDAHDHARAGQARETEPAPPE